VEAQAKLVRCVLLLELVIVLAIRVIGVGVVTMSVHLRVKQRKSFRRVTNLRQYALAAHASQDAYRDAAAFDIFETMTKPFSVHVYLWRSMRVNPLHSDIRKGRGHRTHCGPHRYLGASDPSPPGDANSLACRNFAAKLRVFQ